MRPAGGRGGGAGPSASSGSSLKLILSDDGEFVRGILLDELAKARTQLLFFPDPGFNVITHVHLSQGMDAAWRLSFDSAIETAKAQAALRLKRARSGAVSTFSSWFASRYLGWAEEPSAQRVAEAASAISTRSEQKIKRRDNAPSTLLPAVFTKGVSGTMSSSRRMLPLPQSILLSDPPLVGPSAALRLLETIPKLADTDDKEQVKVDREMVFPQTLPSRGSFCTFLTQIEGLTKLSRALYSLSEGTPEQKQPPTRSGLGSLVSMIPTPSELLLRASAPSEVRQAAAFLEFVARELPALPKEQRERALELPLDVIGRASYSLWID